jgi:sortase A
MLLKVGAAMMLCAVALAAVVAAVLALSGPDEETLSQTASVEPLSTSAQEREKREFDPGEKLVIDDEPKEEPAQEEPAREKPTREKPARDEPTREEPPEKEAEAPTPPTQAPASPENWPAPSGQEVAAAQAPRYYPQREDGVMTLTVEGMGIYDVPVINENSQGALDNGVIHFPETPMPWEERDQKNVYLAGHRLGWPGTGSRLVFYNLDTLKKGDSIVLEDSLGEPYEYRVSEVFVVEPDADWVVDPVRGRDMVTLQTCILPDLLNRLIVRADRV